MTFSEYRQNFLMTLRQKYSPEESSSVFAVLMESRGLPTYYYITEGTSEIDPSLAEWFDSALKRLLGGEPVDYVVGYREFYGRRFNVSRDVLIPRGETEEMCQEGIRHCRALGDTLQGRPLRVLDLCTGSGCIAWTLALETGAEVTAVDISRAALDVASTQPYSASVKFVEADILDVESLCSTLDGGPFDVILSNPPYVLNSDKAQMSPLVLDNDPSLALFVRDEAPQEFNTALGQIARRLLAPGGLIMVEINEALGSDSLRALRSGFGSEADSGIKTDLAGKDRFVFLKRNVS